MEEEIKTLANCTDLEFLKQTNRIRKAVENWLTVTDILNIRRRLPKLETAPENADSKQIEFTRKRNEEIRRNQMKANFNAIMDAMLEDHPEETLEIIRLCCFVEPDDNSHKIVYYMKAFTGMFGNKDVLDFFTSLTSLVNVLGLTM